MSDIVEISNEEVRFIQTTPDLSIDQLNTLQMADMLPSKTVPEANRKRHACPLKMKMKTTRAHPKYKATGHSAEAEATRKDDNACMRNALSNTSVSKSSISLVQITHKVYSLLYHA
jgi:hypothetical protein